MKQLIRKMIEMGIEKELIETVVSMLDTDEQFEKMSQALDNLKTLTPTTILGKALLISKEGN